MVLLKILFLILVKINIISSYTWIDCITKDREIALSKDPNNWVMDNLDICDGYGQDYTSRQDSNLLLRYSKMYYVVDELKGEPLCKTINNIDEKIIKVKYNDTIYISYFENGYITKNKISENTTWELYFGKNIDDLKNSYGLNKNNLLKTGLFDDGVCGSEVDYLGNPTGRLGDTIPCIANFSIPKVNNTGYYPMIWYWRLPIDYGYAFYTCFDIYIESYININSTISPTNNTNSNETTIIPTITPTIINNTINNSNPLINITTDIPINITTIDPIQSNITDNTTIIDDPISSNITTIDPISSNITDNTTIIDDPIQSNVTTIPSQVISNITTSESPILNTTTTIPSQIINNTCEDQLLRYLSKVKNITNIINITINPNKIVIMGGNLNITIIC